MTKHTILFLAANPRGTDWRALDQEAHAIRAELRRSGYRDRFEFETRWAAQPLDLLRELRELKPTVVHFSGPGDPGGLCFQAASGDVQVVSPAAIAEAFGAAGASVKLVVLGACYSDAAAEALLAHLDCVVGMGGAVHPDAVRSFAIGFYGGLGEHESVAAAYEHGRAAISLEGLSERERPRLRGREGFDANRLILAAAAPAVRMDLPCPYPGMRPYAADDAEHFHGRGVEVDDLLGRLRAGEREIYVIGPSGSGKSSLVGAGVLPRLARGVAGLGPFVVRSMRPGEKPAARLGALLEMAPDQRAAPASAIAALLAHRSPGTSVLIMIDQLEELFTLADAGERERFLSALGALRAERRCVVIFTLRADFFGAFMESPLWTERGGRISRIEVGPLRGKSLREAIARPARDLGVRVARELIERLLADAGMEPGVLPLLQETLVQLWDRRRKKKLRLADYQELGDGERSGLAVALSRRADATMRALTPAQQAIAQRILLRLISFGEGRSDIRRQQSRGKLRAAGDAAADFEHVLQQMIADRLLITDDDGGGGEARIDLAHEAMIAAWPTLAGWIETRRADEQRRRQLEAAASQWVEHGRGARGLLDLIELTEAEAWRQTETARELGECADIAALVDASRAKLDKEADEAEARLWIAGGACVGVILLLTISTWTAVSVAHTQEQELQRDVLQSNALAARWLADTVALQLREQVDAVVAIAADPAVARLLHRSDDDVLERLRRESSFDSLSLFDIHGSAVARAPFATGYVGKDYSWRDYYVGARGLGEAGRRTGYISLSYRSEADGHHRFAVSAPVYDDAGTWVGGLMAGIGTDSAWGRVRLDDDNDVRRTAVLVAPRDRSRATAHGAGEYVVILHDDLPHGIEIPIDAPRLRELGMTRAERPELRWIDSAPITDDAHHDPVPGFKGWRWLAGFAPVRDTGFVVIVQTRHDAAIEPNARLSRRFVSDMKFVILAWILGSASLWLYARHKAGTPIISRPARRGRPRGRRAAGRGRAG